MTMRHQYAQMRLQGVPVRCGRAAGLLPLRRLLALTPPARDGHDSHDGVSLDAVDWAWAIATFGIRPLLDHDGLPWEPRPEPTDYDIFIATFEASWQVPAPRPWRAS